MKAIGTKYNGMQHVKVTSKIGLSYGVNEQEFEGHCFNAMFMRGLASFTGDGGNSFLDNSRRPIQAWRVSDDNYTLIGDSATYNRNIQKGQYSFCLGDYYGEGTYYEGIVLGTGNSSTNWLTTGKLDSKILNGSGSEQLVYGITDKSASLNISDPNKMSYTITRTVTNNSGADITVSEIGLYCTQRDRILNYSSDYYYMMARDVFSTPIIIANGESKTFFYTISIEKNLNWSLTQRFLEGIRYAFMEQDPLDTVLDNYFSPTRILCTTDSNPVEQAPESITDIPHGMGDNEIFYWKMNHDPNVMYKEEATKSTISFTQAIWNYGSVSITVPKIYLKGEDYIIAGKKLDTPLVFAPNTGAMLQFDIEAGV